MSSAEFVRLRKTKVNFLKNTSLRLIALEYDGIIYLQMIYLQMKLAVQKLAVHAALPRDEGVVRETACIVRKAHAQTPRSRRQDNRKSNCLSGAFYGGKQRMEKRLKNILQKVKKKNGLSVLVSAVSIAVALGMMAGCSATGPGPSETQTDYEVPSETRNERESFSETPADNAKAQTSPAQTQKQEETEASGTKKPEETLSEDGQEIKEIAEDFVKAYFNGDKDSIQAYLTKPFEWDVDVYTGTGAISELTLKGLADVGKEETGNTQVISLEFRDSAYEDMFLYLTMKFVKQEDGWKIQFYGLEG